MHDLSEYDSGSWNTSYQLSEEEARIEALCDEERYLALHTDLLEEEARQGGESDTSVPLKFEYFKLKTHAHVKFSYYFFCRLLVQ